LNEKAERIVIRPPSTPWGTSLIILGIKALEAAAYGDISFEEKLHIEVSWRVVGYTATFAS